MKRLQQVLSFIAIAYIVYHMYTVGFTVVNVTAFVLFLFSLMMTLTQEWRQKKLKEWKAAAEAEEKSGPEDL